MSLKQILILFLICTSIYDRRFHSIDHHFILGNGEFIEHAVFAGNMYGTSKAAVETVRSKGAVFATKSIKALNTQTISYLKNLI